jgi:hypothetical protein
MGVVGRASRREQPDQHLTASLLGLLIWPSLSKRGHLAAWTPQAQSFANTPFMKCLYPPKSLIPVGNTEWANLRVQLLGERFLG